MYKGLHLYNKEAIIIDYGFFVICNYYRVAGRCLAIISAVTAAVTTAPSV